MSLNPITRHRARCTQTRAQMSDALDGELAGEHLQQFNSHIRWCPNCGRMLRNLRRTIDGLHALRDLPATPGRKPPVS